MNSLVEELEDRSPIAFYLIREGSDVVGAVGVGNYVVCAEV